MNRSRGIARVHVNLFLMTNFLIYRDKEAIRMARAGNLSFIKRVDHSNAKILIEGVNCSGCGVTLLGNLTLNRSLDLFLDINNGMIYDNEKGLGRWVPWINAARYPLKEGKDEFLMRWIGNTTVIWRIIPHDNIFKTDLVSLKGGYAAITSNFEELAEELKNRYFSFPIPFYFPLISNRYSPDGILVGSTTGGYVDPVLYNKIGIAYILCEDEEESLRGDSVGFELIELHGPGIKMEKEKILSADLFLTIAVVMIIASILILIVQRKVSR
ncbi:MAG: hypothetical protein ACP5KE_02715 [Candidatus Methanodesulfokora sp.]